ncbi:hypothetical protein L2E82_49486 [Cichorium intybus]|uniref:Uncharacterized protein n=1 Tax=Cichorium intybus TaxID=13427 RepID=A0ACB8YZR0_CICIN|nr:hypothetical protein L2E82_49486 [Cichorium intybus]
MHVSHPTMIRGRRKNLEYRVLVCVTYSYISGCTGDKRMTIYTDYALLVLYAISKHSKRADKLTVHKECKCGKALVVTESSSSICKS